MLFTGENILESKMLGWLKSTNGTHAASELVFALYVIVFMLYMSTENCVILTILQCIVPFAHQQVANDLYFIILSL